MRNFAARLPQILVPLWLLIGTFVCAVPLHYGLYKTLNAVVMMPLTVFILGITLYRTIKNFHDDWKADKNESESQNEL